MNFVVTYELVSSNIKGSKTSLDLCKVFFNYFNFLISFSVESKFPSPQKHDEYFSINYLFNGAAKITSEFII